MDGHDFRAIHDAFSHFATVADRPKVLIADTIKGKGVSFMEGLAGGDETYHFHAGAPSLKDYLAAVAELTSRTNERLSRLGQPPLTLFPCELIEDNGKVVGVRASVVSGGILCVLSVAVTAAALPPFWSYDDRRRSPDERAAVER